MVFCLDPFGWVENHEIWETDTLRDQELAMDALRRLIATTTPMRRTMTWPMTGTEGFNNRRLGDIGHFEKPQYSHVWLWKQHGDYMKAVGEVALSVKDLNGGEIIQIQPGVFR